MYGESSIGRPVLIYAASDRSLSAKLHPIQTTETYSFLITVVYTFLKEYLFLN